MTTNREWLYSLDVADLSDWFDAEHVDNTRSAKRAAAVERVRKAKDAGTSIGYAIVGREYYPWEAYETLIELLTDDGGLTNLEWLFIDSEQFRQAVSAFAFAHSDDCPTSPTQMVDWLMATHVDAQSKAQSKDAPTLSDLYGILSDANDDFAAENDISADNVDANDENATCNNSGDFVTDDDSREKLEDDIYDFLTDGGRMGIKQGELRTIIGWLDRQAEITRKTEQAAWIQQANGLIHEANVRANELRDELAKRDKGIARLKRQRDEARDFLQSSDNLNANLREMNDALADDNDRLEAECYKLQDTVDNLRAECDECVYKQEFRNMDKLEAERDALQAEYERAVHDAQTLYVKTEAERDELKRKLDIAQRHEERADEECNECDELLGEARAERDALAADLRDCEQQRERLRQALGIAIDHAHEVVSLVNLDGEVIK